MSILIKGIKMPKGCFDCVFFLPYFDICKLISVVPKATMPEECPLAEVPTPHGRLTDTDKLINTLQGLFNKREEEARFTGNREVPVTWNDAIYFIKIASTIIEAEEE